MQQVKQRSAEKQGEHAMSLSKAEHVGEMIYELLRRGKLDKEAFTRRMTQLDLCGSHGRVATCYVTWLLLKNTPDCLEKQFHMSANTLKLREALSEESLKASSRGACGSKHEGRSD